ncbi:MAG TPA: hypothetical protein VMV10_25010 [Pirellulales bacterium]|nr:hypothetical protein [Pirellulales bacterium]
MIAIAHAGEAPAKAAAEIAASATPPISHFSEKRIAVMIAHYTPRATGCESSSGFSRFLGCLGNEFDFKRAEKKWSSRTFHPRPIARAAPILRSAQGGEQPAEGDAKRLRCESDVYFHYVAAKDTRHLAGR